MRALRITLLFPLFGLCLITSLSGQDARTRRHLDDPQWPSVQEHLVDIATATAAALQEQGDLLRVRGFPEDALDYYACARKRGIESSELLDKIGVIHLQLNHLVLAQAYFAQSVKLDRHSPKGWNNLAATEYLERHYSEAVSDYKKALKLDRANALFHANLSTAYFEWKNYKAAWREAEAALRLDEQAFQQTARGDVAAHVLSASDRGHMAFVMAKMYALRGQEPEMLRSLTLAAENGFDLASKMEKDDVLAKYSDDARAASLIVKPEPRTQRPSALLANAGPDLEHPSIAP